MDDLRTPQGEASFRAHYDASQFRTDTWIELKHLTSRWDHATRPSEKEALKLAVRATLDTVEHLERYWVFPGKRVCKELRALADKGWHRVLARQTARIVRLLVDDLYRRRHIKDILREEHEGEHHVDASSDAHDHTHQAETRPYFEVVLVDDVTPEEEAEVRHGLLAMRKDDDAFIYDVVVVPTFEDALIAVLFNHNIQSCILRYEFPFQSENPIPELRHYLSMIDRDAIAARALEDPAGQLGRTLKQLRPEIDLFLVTDEPVEDIAGRKSRHFARVFYHKEDYLELHLSILKEIHDRYDTPFFTALRQYSQKPTGVFHALPISRGKSITKSHWIQDMGQFYGTNIFLAETSATSGGLDSLLQPHGALKRAQEKVARAFGARKSFFVTNGTSTANKIVMQALVQPGDLVLVSRDCHKSHHYALVLSGAYPVYLDPYPLTEYSMYGAVPLAEIKKQLLRLKREGLLDRVRMLLLTSCTFDGVVYNPERIMQEVLAIKPDMIFVWDEAWFAFARFTPTYRRRTSMAAAQTLVERYRSAAYKEEYAAWKKAEGARADDDDAWLTGRHLPDPEKVRVRVYATHSTHKTLTALRQGSMIHVYDQDFERLSHDAFHEAYMTHTSTSPNYQILASLDVGRRQVELEGYELVKKSVELAMMLRARIREHPLLQRYFKVLDGRELIPAEYRPSGLAEFCTADGGFSLMDQAWIEDEFTIDPTRLTVHVGMTGSDGDTFRHMLMDDYDIQINKTSRNTVLFMLNIGTTRGAVAYLLDVLTKVAQEIEEQVDQRSAMEHRIASDRVASLTERLPPLPNFSYFHDAFAPVPGKKTIAGDLRKAFFLAYDQKACEYLPLDGAVARAMHSGRKVVSATFVTPYPPGFPVLVPGQVISEEILAYLQALDVKEIHGYEPLYGLRVFTQEALDSMDGPLPVRTTGDVR